MAIDDANHLGYVVGQSFGSDTIAVIDLSTDTLTRTVQIGPPALGSTLSIHGAIAYDGANGNLYITNLYSGNVTVVDTATDRVVKEIPISPVYANLGGIAYDPANGGLYVVNTGLGKVTVIDGATNRIVGNVTVGSSPNSIAYDAANGNLYVTNTNFYSGNVTVINGTTNHVIANIPLGFGASPHGIAYDSGNGQLFVADLLLGNVTVIDGSTNLVVGNISIGPGSNPFAIAYDSTNGRVYVARWGNMSGFAPGRVTVIDGATHQVVGNLTAGLFPGRLAFDPANGHVYVPNAYSGNITVIDGATDRVVANPRVGSTPYWPAYNPGNGNVYVPDAFGNTVHVVSGSTDKVIASIPLWTGFYPLVAAYDAANGDLYVTDTVGGVDVIDGATDQVITRIVLGPGVSPAGITYNPANGYLYVASQSSNKVFVIDGAANQVVGNVTVGSNPQWIADDTANGHLFVANYFSGNVTVIDGATNRVIANIPLAPGPAGGIAFSEASGHVYVAEVAQGKVAIIDPAANRVIGNITVALGDSFLAEDAANGRLYATNPFSGNVTVIDTATETSLGAFSAGYLPFGVVATPTKVYVTNLGSGTVSILSSHVNPNPTYTVTFGETGLPTGTGWSVTLSGTTHTSTTDSITFTESNGTYPYSVGHVAGYAASPSSGSVIVNGTDVSTPVTFTALPPSTYQVSFTETGLPTGTSWSLTLNGTTQTSTTSTITFSEANGTYSYTVGPVASYTASPSSGSVTVNGGDVTGVSITFAAVPPTTYDVSFTETGLPTGTSWSVTLDGSTHTSTTDTVAFTKSNGTYAYAIAAIPGYSTSTSAGSIVVQGTAVTKSVAWTAVVYGVTFTESGLPASTSWSVTLQGTPQSSSTSSVVFQEPNGTYSFTVSAVTGYTASPASGTVTVNGHNVTQTIGFAATTNAPSISSFTASASAITLGSSVILAVTAAGGSGTLSYAYTGLPAGCSSANSATLTCTPTAAGTFSITVTVTDGAGHSATKSVALTVNSASNPPENTVLGLPAVEGYALIAAFVVAIAVGVTVAVVRSRRKDARPPRMPP